MSEISFRDYYEHLESEPPEKRPTATRAFKEAWALAVYLVFMAVYAHRSDHLGKHLG